MGQHDPAWSGVAAQGADARRRHMAGSLEFIGNGTLHQQQVGSTCSCEEFGAGFGISRENECMRLLVPEYVAEIDLAEAGLRVFGPKCRHGRQLVRVPGLGPDSGPTSGRNEALTGRKFQDQDLATEGPNPVAVQFVEPRQISGETKGADDLKRLFGGGYRCAKGEQQSRQVGTVIEMKMCEQHGVEVVERIGTVERADQAQQGSRSGIHQHGSTVDGQPVSGGRTIGRRHGAPGAQNETADHAEQGTRILGRVKSMVPR